MAILGSIRKRSGLAVTFVGVAILAFIIGDFVRKDHRGHKSIIGEVAGEEITYKEFELKVEENINFTKQGMGKENLSNEEIFSVRENTWTQMVNDIIMNKQYDALGLSISEAEMTDLIQGKNPHRFIVQNFTNPETGQFDHNLVVNFLQTLDQREPAVRKQMENLITLIKADRLTQKFNTLVGKAYYVPKAFAQRDYQFKNQKASFLMVSQSFSNVSDSAVKVDDKDLKAYYDKNVNNFDQNRSCDIDYVVFEVTPSAEDRAAIARQVDQLFKEFATATDIPSFVNNNSDEKYDSTFKKKGQLPMSIDSILFNGSVGALAGPWEENGFLNIARLMDVQSRPDSLKASHILIAYKGAYGADEKIKRSKEAAKKTADSLVAVVKADATKLASLAVTLSSDPSAAKNSGDLGWFPDGQMVPAFNNAVLNNPVNTVLAVETPFGYHVIKVTGKTAPIKKVKVAIVKRELAPSNQTIQTIFSKASQFAGQNRTADAFEKAIAAQGLNKRTKEYIAPMDATIPGLKSPRELIRWAFSEDVKVGDVSDAKDVDGSFVVAALKTVREKGIAPFEQVKELIKPNVMREKKVKLLADKMTALKAVSIEDYASKLQAKVDTLNDITFSAFNIPMVGREPKVLGRVFSLNNGELSSPIEGSNFAVVVKLNKIDDSPSRDNFMIEQKQAENAFLSRASSSISKVLEKAAEVQDNRVLFY